VAVESRSQSNNGTTTSVQKVVVVQQGDTLYGIAQRECGSGAAVDALAAANIGRLQPDGSILTNPNLLKPGYEVVISCQTVSR
jgi:nucleoid-associated protein YgaU